MNILENEHIRLRAPEKEDLEFLYLWENDTNLWNAGITLAPLSKDILKQYIASSHQDIFQTKQLRLMIESKAQSVLKVIGAIDLFDFDPYHLRAGVGILIAHKDDRNKGFASQSLELMINYCFHILSLHLLYCNIEPTNTPSIALFENQGFIKVGIKKKWNRNGVHWQDELLYQLINQNWA